MALINKSILKPQEKLDALIAFLHNQDIDYEEFAFKINLKESDTLIYKMAFISTTKLAQILNTNPITIHRWSKKTHIKCVKSDYKYFYCVDDLIVFFRHECKKKKNLTNP